MTKELERVHHERLSLKTKFYGSADLLHSWLTSYFLTNLVSYPLHLTFNVPISGTWANPAFLRVTLSVQGTSFKCLVLQMAWQILYFLHPPSSSTSYHFIIFAAYGDFIQLIGRPIHFEKLPTDWYIYCNLPSLWLNFLSTALSSWILGISVAIGRLPLSSS